MVLVSIFDDQYRQQALHKKSRCRLFLRQKGFETFWGSKSFYEKKIKITQVVFPKDFITLLMLFNLRGEWKT